MKAAVCWEAGKPLVVEDVVLDPPKTGEVRVRIGAVAICHSDVHLVRGDWTGWSSTPPPVVAGHEAAGVVDGRRPGVTRVRPGDRVVVSLLRTCGACVPCLTGAAYLCEGRFALLTEHRLHARSGQALNLGHPRGRVRRGHRRRPVPAGAGAGRPPARPGVPPGLRRHHGRGRRPQHRPARARQQRRRHRRGRRRPQRDPGRRARGRLAHRRRGHRPREAARRADVRGDARRRRAPGRPAARWCGS